MSDPDPIIIFSDPSHWLVTNLFVLLLINCQLFSQEMCDIIVEHTNECIAEAIEERGYTAERLKRYPYIKAVDRVSANFVVDSSFHI